MSSATSRCTGEIPCWTCRISSSRPISGAPAKTSSGIIHGWPWRACRISSTAAARSAIPARSHAERSSRRADRIFRHFSRSAGYRGQCGGYGLDRLPGHEQRRVCRRGRRPAAHACHGSDALEITLGNRHQILLYHHWKKVAGPMNTRKLINTM